MVWDSINQPKKDSGIHNNRMVKERAHNMSVQQGMNCACAAASGTVVSGQIVQDTAIRREYPQEITAFPCKPEHECENKTYPANDIKKKNLKFCPCVIYLKSSWKLC